MRQVGLINSGQQAEVFADYLVSEGIAAHAEKENGQWAIWVRDENHLRSATEKLGAFIDNPSDQRYQGVSRRAEEVRQEEAKRRHVVRKNMVEMRTQWKQGMSRKAPFVFFLIGVSVLVGILTGLDGKPDRVLVQLTFSQLTSLDFFEQIKQGQLWRLVTPIFVHFSLIHIGFNMYMLYYLGSQIESRFGTLWFGSLVLVIAATSNIGQAYMAQTLQNDIVGSSPMFGGMSGVNYGLFGYLWMKTLYAPQDGLYVSQGTIFILLAWFVICLMPSMQVANGAHGVGLVVGMALGYAPELLKQLKHR